ncbi:MAG: HNH endonuclease [Acidimicrobiaceae bacterium]|nr:HNH endonuclease [Acidimicrobiaceae bacterium]
MNRVAIISLIALVAFVVLRSRGSRVQKDPRRRFTANDRAVGFARAGNRCEHISLLGRRCTAAPPHGDHHYPWSRGGATTLSNFVALCARHNLSKGSRVPSPWATRRLERRRRAYFPPGTRTDIEWRTSSRAGS